MIRCCVDDCEEEAMGLAPVSVTGRPKQLMPVCQMHFDAAVEDQAEEPTIVTKPGRFHNLWWWIRGVTRPEDYRGVCQRCGRSGQVHYQFKGCWRFKRDETKLAEIDR